MPHVYLCASICLSVVYIFFVYLLSVTVVFVYIVIHVLFTPVSLSFLSLGPCLPFLFFIPVSLSDGRSSSQALREEKEAPPLNPPHSRKGRFHVTATSQIVIFVTH